MNPKSYFWSGLFPVQDLVHVDALVRNGGRVWHRHDYTEVVLVCSGYGRFQSKSHNATLKRGVLLVIPPDTEHAYSQCREAQLLFLSIRPEILEGLSVSLGVRPSVLAEIGLGFPRPDAINRSTFLRADEHSLPVLERTIKDIAALHRHHGIAAQFLRTGHVLFFLGQVLAHSRISRAAPPSCRNLNLHSLTMRALSLLRTDPVRSWRMSDLCKSLQNVHPVYLSRVFRQDMNMGPMRYLRYLRCQEAARLLSTSPAPMKEISFRVGWDDPNLFSRRFRSFFGMTPSVYRSTHKVGPTREGAHVSFNRAGAEAASFPDVRDTILR